MRKILLIIALSVFVTNIYAQKKIKKIKMNNEIDTLSYALGVSIATNLKTQNINDLNPIAVAKAIQDVYGNEKTLIDKDKANEIIQKYFDKQEESKHSAIIEVGKKFLAENTKKEGVITLPSGLQYKIIKNGTGKTPVSTDKVKTHYKGTLIDGTIFDSSYDRGEAVVFGVTQVIKGWTEALQLMKEGGIWELYIPSDLAYGSRDMGKIKPFSTLIFTIELISIEK